MATTPRLTAAQVVEAAVLRAALLDHLGGDGQLLLAHAVIQQGLEGLVEHGDGFSEDEERDPDGDEGIQQIEVVAQRRGDPDAEQTGSHPERGQHIRLQMQGIGGQRH